MGGLCAVSLCYPFPAPLPDVRDPISELRGRLDQIIEKQPREPVTVATGRIERLAQVQLGVAGTGACGFDGGSERRRSGLRLNRPLAVIAARDSISTHADRCERQPASMAPWLVTLHQRLPRLQRAGDKLGFRASRKEAAPVPAPPGRTPPTWPRPSLVKRTTVLARRTWCNTRIRRQAPLCRRTGTGSVPRSLGPAFLFEGFANDR